MFKFTKIRYKRLDRLIPIARQLAKMPNYKFIYTMFYIIENACKWMALPKKYGTWLTVYMKFSRWSKNGIIAKAIFFFKTLILE